MGLMCYSYKATANTGFCLSFIPIKLKIYMLSIYSIVEGGIIFETKDLANFGQINDPNWVKNLTFFTDL